jgi:seryl-tRNA synthetase
MAAAPTIAPFQLEATPPPLRSPFRNAAAHSRNNSDAMVQGMIARFDGLSVRDWKVQGEVAVKRAEMAREMAEMESEKFKKQVEHLKLQMKSDEEERKKAREDARKVKKDVEEAKDRERKLTRRIEVLMVCFIPRRSICG